jgi:hypothetical protein
VLELKYEVYLRMTSRLKLGVEMASQGKTQKGVKEYNNGANDSGGSTLS